MHLPIDAQNLENHPYHRPPVRPQIQNLRSFIVQIRDTTNEEVVGTGFVIQGGYILTCAHVAMVAGVKSCSSEPPLEACRSFLEKLFQREIEFTTENIAEETLWVRFPQSKALGEKDYRARVYACLLNDFQDDIVMLELVDAQIPAGVGYARLGLAGPTTLNAMPNDRQFRSYGYRSLGDFDGGLWCEGITQDFVGTPSGRILQQEPLQLNSKQISKGMSGAPVLDISRNLVIGLIAETWKAWGEDFSDRDTAFATAMEVVQDEPFRVPLHEETSSPSPYTSNDSRFCNLGTFANGNFRNPSPFASEASTSFLGGLLVQPVMVTSIIEAWLSDERSCLEIYQFEEGTGNNSSENGNSSVSINQILLGENIFPEHKKPQRILWWDFGLSPYFEDLLDACFYMLDIDPDQITTFKAKVSLIKRIFFENQNILVLSGPLTEVIIPDSQSLEDVISQLVSDSSLCLLIR